MDLYQRVVLRSEQPDNGGRSRLVVAGRRQKSNPNNLGFDPQAGQGTGQLRACLSLRVQPCAGFFVPVQLRACLSLRVKPWAGFFVPVYGTHQ